MTFRSFRIQNIWDSYLQIRDANPWWKSLCNNPDAKKLPSSTVLPHAFRIRMWIKVNVSCIRWRSAKFSQSTSLVENPVTHCSSAPPEGAPFGFLACNVSEDYYLHKVGVHFRHLEKEFTRTRPHKNKFIWKNTWILPRKNNCSNSVVR